MQYIRIFVGLYSTFLYLCAGYAKKLHTIQNTNESITYECHENDIKGKCPNGKCPSYEIYDILEGK